MGHTPSSTRRRTVACAVAGVLAALMLPREAAAQKDTFIDALIAFRTSLAGNFGDEGPQVAANLERMATSLDVWDKTIASAEADLRAGLSGATREQTLRVRLELTSLFLQRGRFAEGLAEIDRAIAVDPQRAAFHLFRGLIHDTTGAVAEARKDFERAWTLDPPDPIKAYLLADHVPAPGDRQPQIDQLMVAQQALMAAQQAAVPAIRAPISFIRLPLIEDRAADWPVYSPAAYAEGFALVAERRYPDAVASFRAAASRDPLLVDPVSRTERMSQGVASLRERKFAVAVGHLEAVVSSAPESSEAHRILAAAYVADGRHADAIQHLRTALRLAPGDERVRMALGRALIRDGLWKEAEQALRDTIAALPKSADARWVLADLYEQESKGPDAMRELEAATPLPWLAGKGQLYWRLADLYHRHQDYESVTRTLSERARLDPNSAIVHKDLGLAHMRRGSRQDALIELLMSSLLGPEDAETLATIGQIHLDSGRYAPAEAVLRRAVALVPTLAQARFALGMTLVRSGRSEEGRQQLAEFQRLRTAALDDQRRTFAVETLRRDADLRTSEGRHDLAAGVWQQIVDFEPAEPAHRIALAGALARAGQLEGAVTQLEKAAAMNAGSSVHRQLASLYEKLGRAEDSARAQATYERLLRETSKNPETAR
jgi:tetratricopeptide (TPR) repeat protein